MDRRTTPRWARVPALVLLAVLSLYFLACFHRGQGESLPTWSWMGRWHMFTNRSSWHKALEAEVQVDGEWQEVALEELFPTRWDSGPRYARSSFWRSSYRRRVLSAAVCGRHPDDPSAVRLREVRWRVTIGSVDQPRRKVREKQLLVWRCGDPVPLPQGRLL